MSARDVFHEALVDVMEESDAVVDKVLDALIYEPLMPLLAAYLYDHNIELAHVLRRVST